MFAYDHATFADHRSHHLFTGGCVAACTLYLSTTNVRNLAPLIRSGTPVCHGIIPTLADLGSLPTFWANLGELTCSRGTYRVSEVLSALERPDCTDLTTLPTIKKYLALLASGTLQFIVTIAPRDNVATIYDGNKRAVAYFEYHRVRDGAFPPLPVFFVDPDQ